MKCTVIIKNYFSLKGQCHEIFASGFFDESVSPQPQNIALGQRHRWCTLSCEFSKKFETALLVYSGAWGELIHEKKQKSKISWHCPFNWANACDIMVSDLWDASAAWGLIKLCRRIKMEVFWEGGLPTL